MNLPLRDTPDEDTLDFGDLNASLGFLLRVAQLQAFDSFYAAFDATQMKPGEFTVLRLIGLNPGRRQGVIAKALRIKPAHMTKLIQRMVDAGYVEREATPEDRRSVTLSLTRDGQRFVDHQQTTLKNLEIKDRSGFAPEEFDQILTLLKRYIAGNKRDD
ncbi:MarR family winged helix-turn-helix transcriptional regulator [Puniceibacterium sp. IMCC21224]|uniref:MarR family winged helix-turn-helix transcriptional regulator n=1 Tax=Puniceibacterium sp. IMCC21224 TaxID=1618204 RepID=UPI00064DBC36|nr:MarR family transcriptional regulator [Puniceibacterium sp. IMCC21224]KMK66557.1 transcriptional regulator [Puniceibacterium sp. IMCC21224]